MGYQLNGVLHSVKLGTEGRIIVRIYSCPGVEKMLSQKLCLVGLLIEPETEVIMEWDQVLNLEVKDGQRVDAGKGTKHSPLEALVEQSCKGECHRLQAECSAISKSIGEHPQSL